MRTQLFALFTISLVAMAQEPTRSPNDQPTTGWRRFEGGSAAPADATFPDSAPMAPARPVTVPAGTWITVRVNEPLSSDRNQQGDVFTASLAQPLVADGRLIARRGQTVQGGIVEAQKAGHITGTSRLGLELTELGLINGRQAQIHTKMMQRQGDTSVGQDVAAVGTATGIGAAIGAAADGGFGAGMGAIAGAGASVIGVLATRGRATEVYPEMLLTFRLEAPITFDEQTAEAFPPVLAEDYEQRAEMRQGPRQGPQRGPRPGYYGGYPPPYYGGYYPPYVYGPSVMIYSGPRYYGRYYGRGYRRW